MAEKQNLGEVAVSTSNDKKKASIAALAKLIKAQCTSQRRSHSIKSTSPPKRLKHFLIKVAIAGSAVYLTSWLGVWGEAEQTKRIMNKIKRAIHKIDNDSTGDKFPDVREKIGETKSFLRCQLESIPEELKAYYDKSEKYFSDFIKGKRP